LDNDSTPASVANENNADGDSQEGGEKGDDKDGENDDDKDEVKSPEE